MHIRNPLTWGKRTAVVIAGSALALGMAAGPALAGGAPTTCPTTSSTGVLNSQGHNVYGGDCTITGTISIASIVSLATNVTSFSLNGNNLNSPSPATPFQVLIGNTDGNGYYLDEQGPSGGFTDGHGHVVPDTAVVMDTYSGSQAGNTCPAVNSEGYTQLIDPTSNISNPLSYQIINVPNQTSGQLNCGTFDSSYTPPTGFDSFNLKGWELTTVDGSPAGTYTGNVLISAWGV